MNELQYIPLALPFFLFLVGLFLVIVVLIQIHALQYAYAKLGLSSGAECGSISRRVGSGRLMDRYMTSSTSAFRIALPCSTTS